MIYVIMNSDVGRSQQGRSWPAKASVFAASSALAGVAAGAALGALGGTLSVSTRHTAAVGLAVIAVVLGTLEATGRSVVAQRNCEVPQRVMHRGALRGAAHYGASLGVGASSRIGFALWYVVPSSAILSGSPLNGAIVYGVYAATRGLAPVVVLGLRHMSRSGIGGTRAVELWLLRQQGSCRRLAGAQLIIMGVMAIVLLSP